MLPRLCDMFGTSRSAFFRQLGKDPANRDAYTRAREYFVEGIAEDILGIADNEPDPQRARNRIDARRWYAEKMNPKRFGPKLDLTTTERPMNPAELLRMGQERARLMCDPVQLPGSQDVEDAQILPGNATDTQSVGIAAPQDAPGTQVAGDPADIFT